MKIKLTNVSVDDQAKALQFYTEVLGFVKKNDISMGEYRWLTVVAPDGNDTELLLEPMAFAPAKVYQQALFQAGIPAAIFEVQDLHAEYERLKSLGVIFKREPLDMGMVIIASFEDTCGNIIQINQMRR